MNKHTLADLVPVGPPTAVTSLSLLGVGLDQWVLILNAIYISLGIMYLIYRMVKGKTDDSK